ncbi:hypothetical protein QNI19_36870 [Cytophagaceae bacterium DM2B3-1]|uniref:Thioredoxin-like fold domain-containing protein n=1 Tax=Xanthocytophaga flava TaxID=3048013 RepID=A0ABT7CY30_9BACT|nr:hypothetical protein [Xanthocytophaga flavus]MDJ1472884.1 hypothetical protein [Xanthocytophaga flavus]MDJ1498566.1 hypothetical protein [Xanthocytophaga flavus]
MLEKVFNILVVNPTLRYQKINRLNAADLGKVDTGIVYLYASWSGQSLITLRLWMDISKDLDLTRLNFYVIDIDNFYPSYFKQYLNYIPQGKGEIFWIKDSNVIWQFGNSSHQPVTVVSSTNRLASEQPKGKNSLSEVILLLTNDLCS